MLTHKNGLVVMKKRRWWCKRVVVVEKMAVVVKKGQPWRKRVLTRKTGLVVVMWQGGVGGVGRTRSRSNSK